MPALGSGVQSPAGPPDRESALLQRDLVVGQHEAHALVFAEGLAECGPGAGVIDGDRVCAHPRAEPAHGMGEPGRGQAHLGVAQRLTHFAEHRRSRQSHVVEPHHTVALDVVAVHGVHHPLEIDSRSGSFAEEQRRAVGAVRVGGNAGHDDPRLGAVGSGDQPLESVDHVLAAVEDGLGLQLAGIGSRAAGFGHREHRTLPALDHRHQELLGLLGVGDPGQDVHIGLVGCGAVQSDRSEGGPAGRLEQHRLFPM